MTAPSTTTGACEPSEAAGGTQDSALDQPAERGATRPISSERTSCLDTLNHGWRTAQVEPVGVLVHDALDAEWLPRLRLFYVAGRLLEEVPVDLDDATRIAARKLMELDAYREHLLAYEQHERGRLQQKATRGPTRPERRARAYLAQLPPSIAHAGGAAALFTAASVCVRGFALGFDDAFVLLREYDRRSVPPWGERELARVLRNAAQRGKRPLGWLL